MIRELRLAADAAATVRSEIDRANGNEVCFLARVGDDGDVTEPRVVARGHRSAVLAAAADAAAGMLLIHNHPSGELEPSDADLAVAASLYERGVGMAITDNRASELYVVVEPAVPRSYEILEEAGIAALLAPGGPLSREHDAYEDRPSQRDFAAAVVRAYNRGGVLLAEAGTGTGKSVAYLVPAIAWAAANKERTIVSTNTINLQEQLVAKDLPLLRRMLGVPFSFALVKGRNNYVSIRRARLAAESALTLLDDGPRAELDAILEWIRSTGDGSLQDLPFTPSAATWDEVMSDSDACMRTRCPHYRSCFYQRARRDAAAADILVVNHHLLFSDLAVRRAQGNYTGPAVLPPYRRLVLDEAHNIEDTATEHLGAGVSRSGVLRILGRLDRRGRGILASISRRLGSSPDDLVARDALRHINAELRPDIERAREITGQLFDALSTLSGLEEEGVVRLDEHIEGSPVWSGTVEPLADSLVVALERLARGIGSLRERIRLDAEWARALEEYTLELAGVVGRLENAAHGLGIALRPGHDAAVPVVRWVERRGHGPSANVLVRAAPVEVSGLLRQELFDRVDTVILTSATLTTSAGFGFTRDRLGLTTGGVKLSESVFESPFDYESSSMIAVPTDLPEPRGEAAAIHDEATARVIREMAEITDGGLLVLFTSYRSLIDVAARLRSDGATEKWPVFVQGENSRARLLDAFAASGRGILLGVASFWEGVDVPGEPLRGLIVTKIPFRVPTEPLTATRIEYIEANGGNSFREYMLPHAALRLKQGFGRLIRTRRDRGVVVILDARIAGRSYGRYLIESLPAAPASFGTWESLREEIRAFYGR